MSAPARPWFRCVGPRRPSPLVRLVAFPHAGGSSSMFADWPLRLPPQIELWGAILPGRERALAEPAMTDARELAARLAGHLDEVPAGPMTLFGHSMGGLLAFETWRALRRAGGALPGLLLVSSCPSPALRHGGARIHALPDAALLDELRRLQGTAPELFADREFLELVLPTLRADFKLTETYRYEAEERITCPISVYGGASDDHVSAAELEAWRLETSSGFRRRMFSGDHFWIRDPAQLLTAIARDALDPGAGSR